jgi:ankyrin repeat protein
MRHRTAALVIAAFTVTTSACVGPDPRTPLASAAWDGRLGDLRALLARGIAPDTLDGAWTPLIYAARRGHLDVMRALVDAGADPNRIDTRNRWTPLMHALHTHRREAALLLLERGADPRVGTADGFGPLAMAALDNDAAMIRTLISKGAPPTRQVERALEIAVSGGTLVDIDRPLLGACYADALRVLLEANPRVQVPGGSGSFSPVWWASVKRCEEVVRLVQQRQALVASK